MGTPAPFKRRTPKKQVCVCLTESQLATVRKHCHKEGITYGELIMRAIPPRGHPDRTTGLRVDEDVDDPDITRGLTP